MSSFARIAPSEMRDAPRKHVLMQATIHGADGQQRAFVKDLTPTGARIQCDRPLDEESDVLFRRGEICRAARVAWSNGDEAGLQFYREL